MSLPKPSSRPVVLVVEDEALILFSIADDLRRAGFDVLEALNADAAIVLLESRADITVLFTDVDMPGSMDGLKLSTAVRDRWPPVKIILTSGHVKLKLESLPTGGRFFSKPYDAMDLVATIRELTAA